MELHKLQILAGEASSGHHRISVSRAGVSRRAAEIGSSVTAGNRDKCWVTQLDSHVSLKSTKQPSRWERETYPVAMTVFWALKRWMEPSSMHRAITPLHSPSSISRSRAKYSTK